MVLVGQRLDRGKGVVRGDVHPIRRRIADLRGTSVSKAKLTVKEALADADGAAKISKSITTTGTADGQIEDNGATSQVAVLKFSIANADWETLTAGQEYFYDIQVHYSDGAVITEESGFIAANEEVTQDDT